MKVKAGEMSATIVARRTTGSSDRLVRGQEFLPCSATSLGTYLARPCLDAGLQTGPGCGCLALGNRKEPSSDHHRV